MCSPMLPMKVAPYPIYTLFKDLKGGMVGMEFKDEMVEMGPQDYQERGVSLVHRDHLGHQVCSYCILLVLKFRPEYCLAGNSHTALKPEVSREDIFNATLL